MKGYNYIIKLPSGITIESTPVSSVNGVAGGGLYSGQNFDRNLHNGRSFNRNFMKKTTTDEENKNFSKMVSDNLLKFKSIDKEEDSPIQKKTLYPYSAMTPDSILSRKNVSIMNKDTQIKNAINAYEQNLG